MSDELEELERLIQQKQRERGFTEYFKVGELVRFPKGNSWTRETDYTIETIYMDGFRVSSINSVSGEKNFQGFMDADCQRLGMTHSPEKTDDERRTVKKYVAKCSKAECSFEEEFPFDERGWADLQKKCTTHMDETGHGVNLSTKENSD